MKDREYWVCAAAMAGLLRVLSTGAAIGLHAALAPVIFLALAAHYDESLTIVESVQ